MLSCPYLTIIDQDHDAANNQELTAACGAIGDDFEILISAGLGLNLVSIHNAVRSQMMHRQVPAFAKN